MATNRGNIRRVIIGVREKNKQVEIRWPYFSVEEEAEVGLEPPVQVHGQRRTKK